MVSVFMTCVMYSPHSRLYKEIEIKLTNINPIYKRQKTFKENIKVTFTLGSDVTHKNALTFEPFVRF